MTDREYVIRPDGKRWAFDARSPRSVARESTPEGPVVLVLRTHDLERAARMAEVRWTAFHPGVPMPEGVREWRRQEMISWQRRSGGSDFTLAPSSGTESQSCPVVAFRLATTEGAA